MSGLNLSNYGVKYPVGSNAELYQGIDIPNFSSLAKYGDFYRPTTNFSIGGDTSAASNLNGMGIKGALPSLNFGENIPAFDWMTPSTWANWTNPVKDWSLTATRDGKTGDIKGGQYAELAKFGLGLANLYQGMQGHKLAKETFNFQKDMSLKNYANTVKTTNAHLNDQANARYASNNSAYMKPEDYMAKYGVA